MEIHLLDNSGIDKQYFQRKDVLTHSVLYPIMKFEDSKGKVLQLYMSRKNVELETEYPKELIKKLDKAYIKMLMDKQAFLVKLIHEQDIQVSLESNCFPDAVFYIFKDEILNIDPQICLKVELIDVKTYFQQQMN